MHPAIKEVRRGVISLSSEEEGSRGLGSFPGAQVWDNFRQRGQYKQTAPSGQAGTLQQFRAAEACEEGSEHRGFFTRMYLRQ